MSLKERSAARAGSRSNVVEVRPRSLDRRSAPAAISHRARAAWAALPLVGVLVACGASAPLPVEPPAPPPPTAVPSPMPSAEPAPPPAPVAAVRPIVETAYGVTITDPYRWMEEPGSAELAALLRDDAAFARRTLDAIPERGEWLARIQAIHQIGVEVADAALWKGTYTYLESEPGRDGRSLYARAGLRGPERRIIDAEALGAPGARPGITRFFPSIDSRYIAYGLSSGGAGDGLLHLVETASRAPLPERIDRVPSPAVAWQTDGRSFFYLRAEPGAPGRVRAHVHEIGRDPGEDPPIFGPGVVAELPIADDDRCELSAPPGNRHVFAAVHRHGRREIDLYAAPAASIPDDLHAWKKIVDADAHEAVAFDVHGDDLYLLSHRGAPRFQVIRTSVTHPFVLRASALVAESEVVIASFGVARDAIYLREIVDDHTRLRRISFKGGRGEILPLPFQGTIPRILVQPFAPGVLFQLGSPIVPARFFAYDAKAKDVIDLGLVPPLPLDLTALASRAITARSADGTEVPLTLVHRSDLAHDGSHPAWLRVSAAHGRELDPTLRPTDLAWLSRGGVLAYCHARGGGERGEAWHRAAMGEHKPRSIEDVIACGKALIAGAMTGPTHLGVDGRDAGALVAAGAITRAPELFAAALIQGGHPEALRLGGTAIIDEATELGTATNEAGWKALLAVDACQQVTAGTRYPAVLLTARQDEPRSPAWQQAKLAARLRAATTSAKPVVLRVLEGTGKARDEEALADEMAFLWGATR